VIAPLEPDDTGEYLRLQLRPAGRDRESFAFDTIALLHEAPADAMRDIDCLAATPLGVTARRKRSSSSATASPASSRRTLGSASNGRRVDGPIYQANG
jgi:hypothetical protein